MLSGFRGRYPWKSALWPHFGQVTQEPWSPFFFAQMFLKDFGPDAQDEIAHLKLGLAEQLTILLADHEPSEVADFFLDGLLNLCFQHLRFGFLFRRECNRYHGQSSQVDFPQNRLGTD